MIGQGARHRPNGNGSNQKTPPGSMKRAAMVLEAWDDLYDTYVDPRDALWDDDSGELWTTLRAAWSAATKSDQVPQTEGELKNLRDECRLLVQSNEWAINAIENRISYTVGTGHSYKVASKPGMEVPDESLAEVQAVLDEWMDASGWWRRQQEIRRRLDRDGECFLRLFPRDGEILAVRFVEPGQVSTPAAYAQSKADAFGVRTDPDDVETVLGYWIDGELVPPENIQHRKANVDANVKRGLPLLYPVRKNLKRAGKLLRNMSVVAEIQAAIALIRKHSAGTRTGIESYVSGKADQQISNSSTGTTANYRQYAPGTILDAPATTEYQFPAEGIDASRYVTVLQAELRAVASRLCMPEFMLSSDASNANYSSTMVAEGPSVKTFQRLQWETIDYDRKLIDRVLDLAVASGRLDGQVREQVLVDITPPSLITRDRSQDVQADVALVSAKIMSIRTAQVKNDLDPDVEEENIENEAEASMARNPFAGVGFGQGNGAGQDDEEDDGEDDQDIADDGQDQNQ